MAYINDYVYCNMCGREQVVELGSDTCLFCETDGCLSWVDDELQEVEHEPEVFGMFNREKPTL